jgi:hypothetical protein
MKTITNPRQRMIYNILMEDIENNGTGYSVLTNTEIYELLEFKVSPFSVRDHIIALANNKFIQKLNNSWIEEDYYSRVIYKGINGIDG